MKYFGRGVRCFVRWRETSILGRGVPLRDKENLLFRQWITPDDQEVIPDGAVDEEAFRDGALKILFVLKEVNDRNGRGWDLRRYLAGYDEGNHQYPRWQTWSNITRWIIGIRRLPHITPWDHVANIDLATRRNVLRSIAVMNLKKWPGGPVAK